MTEQSWHLTPGSELTDVLNGLRAEGPTRDVMAFLYGRDPEAFAMAVAFARPDALPERLRGPALDVLNRSL